VVVDHNPIIETLADFSFILADNPQLPKTDIAFISNNYLNIADNLGYQINPNTDILYRVEELDFAYPQLKPLFTKLTVEIGSKQNILLTGNNGAGKSSFLKLLAGLIKPLKGKIYLGGKLMQGLDTKNFEYIYYQSQITKENLLGISVAQNWLFWQLAIKQLPDLPLKDDPLFTELSAGQQKMVSQQILPQLLSKFWILDEPFASLDKDAGTKLLQLLQYKSKKHPGMLIVSHSLEEHNDMFDRVLTIRNHFLQEETK
jgi:ABC-type Mn2+/Zn2+ transport system ATPase subunit